MKCHLTNAKENAALITKDGRLRGFLNEGHIFKLNWIKDRGLNRLFSNQLFSRDKKDNRLIENVVIIGSHKIHIGMQIIGLENPRLLSILLAR